MITEVLTPKLAFAGLVIGLLLMILVFRAIGQLIGKGARALRDRPGQSGDSSDPDSMAPDMPQDPVSEFGRRRRVLADEHAPTDTPDFTHPVLGEMTSAEVLRAVADANLPPPPHQGPLSDAIDAARRRAIVFREFQPLGPGKDGLSFYGGLPIGPADFQWPRRHGSEGVPLTFIMQWDCTQLAAQDTTGLLPSDGVLYCFIDLEWGSGDTQARIEAFLHHPGPTEGWAEIALPADAPPIFGDAGASSVTGCSDKVDNALDFVPRVMPRFPFAPLALDYPQVPLDDDEADRLFWESEIAGEAQLAVAKTGQAEEPVSDLEGYPPSAGRPFEAFPHDFGAIRVLATKMIKDVTSSHNHPQPSATSELSEEERAALAETCLGEAKELYRLGCQRPMGTPLDQALADDIWHWLESRKGFIRYGFDDIVVEAVDLSLGISSRALDRVPAEWVDRAMRRHELASEFMTHEYFNAAKHGDWKEYDRLKAAGEIPRMRKIHAPVPAHMFGPPSYVQGYVEELVDEHILLLELPSHGAPGLSIGEGVLQYMIRPDDLAARRFDRVQSVISGY